MILVVRRVTNHPTNHPANRPTDQKYPPPARERQITQHCTIILVHPFLWSRFSTGPEGKQKRESAVARGSKEYSMNFRMLYLLHIKYHSWPLFPLMRIFSPSSFLVYLLSSFPIPTFADGYLSSSSSFSSSS